MQNSRINPRIEHEIKMKNLKNSSKNSPKILEDIEDLENELDSARIGITENKFHISRIKEWIEEHKLFGDPNVHKLQNPRPKPMPLRKGFFWG